ncbi:MAG: hypothetical protein HPY44_20230 [Armatimonadetes bacterium]|nr:hypothetical protein [Armatimonadota bacterium]
MPVASAAAIAFAVLLCASHSIAAEFVPTVKLDGQAVTTSGLPLYGFARFMQPALDLAGEWQRWVFSETFAALEEQPPVAGTLWWTAYEYASPRRKPELIFHAFGLHDFPRQTQRLVADALSKAYCRAMGKSGGKHPSVAG